MKSAALIVLAATLVAAPASAQEVKWRLIGVSFGSLVLAPDYPQPRDYRYFKKSAPPYATAELAFGVTPLSSFMARKAYAARSERVEDSDALAHLHAPPIDGTPPGS